MDERAQNSLSKWNFKQLIGLCIVIGGAGGCATAPAPLIPAQSATQSAADAGSIAETMKRDFFPTFDPCIRKAYEGNSPVAVKVQVALDAGRLKMPDVEFSGPLSVTQKRSIRACMEKAMTLCQFDPSVEFTKLKFERVLK